MFSSLVSQRFICTVAILFSGLSFGANSNDQVKLQLLAGLVKPPFIVEQNGRGLQLDIIREALAFSNIDVDFIHMPLARHMNSYRQLMLDGIITLPQGNPSDDIHLSVPYIHYQNVAISITENDFDIEALADLKNKSISAFQNATEFLGETYKDIATNAPYYEEVADQKKQMRNLYELKVEVAIADINIFKFFIKEQTSGIYNRAVSIHKIFPERPYVIGFRSDEIRNKFDLGLFNLQQSGRYKAIIEQYQSNH